MSGKECYVAGNINIGKKEKDRRYRNGWIYLGITVLLFILMVYLDLPQVYRLIIYVPATISALGFLQAANSFCVYYGLKREYRLDHKTSSIDDDESILLDKKASINIIVVASSIGLVIAIFAYVLL